MARFVRFVVVKDASSRHRLGELAAGQSFVGQAPVVIACCGKRYVDRYSWLGERMYIVDVTIAIDHLTLAARNEGLGTCWIGAFDHDGVKNLLGLSDGYDVIMLIPLGYPSSDSAFHETGNRIPLEKMVFSERFGR